ncbi:hypothetical protein EIP91_005434 [Steccherinum ochraceum]|uniref:F-box domain-containing protein n=1 Tax=Steccherinum ochraceum TaxID=92696 RepID=A0A4R0S2C4_9APHY|nr:hypothetical protein EIP91_005434 [Steccherinum ochraceum]
MSKPQVACQSATLSSSPITFVDSFREGLQAEVEEHIRAIASLRVRMNTVIPIAQLPSEILSHIFTLYAAVMKNHYTYTRRGPPHYYWMDVTHVCHYWREAALGDPRLWSDILVTAGSVARVEELLNRSKQTKLHVEIDATEVKWLPTLQRIAREAGRIETLILKQSTSALLFSDHFPLEVPLLRHLILKGDLGNYGYQSGQHLKMPVPLTTWSMPSLVELRVSSLPVDWANMVLPSSLVHLHITHGKVALQISNVIDVARAIGSLVALETLEFRDPTTSQPSQASLLSAPDSTFSLPNLKFIDLAGPFMPIIFLLDHLIVPASTKMLLSFTFPSFSDAEVPQIARSLAPKLSQGLVDDGKQAIWKVSIAPDTLLFYKRADTPARPAWFHVSITLPRRIIESGSIFRDLLPHLPIRDTERLVLSDVPYVPQDWMRTLRAMPFVRTLTLEHDRPGLDGVQKVLRLCTGVGTDGRKIVVFPVLRYLILAKVRFREAADLDDLEDSELVTELGRTLRMRRGQGSKLKKIYIRECLNMDDPDVERLEKRVDVDWDHKIEFEEVEDSEDELSSDGFGYGGRDYDDEFF